MRKRINDLYDAYCVERKHSEFYILDNQSPDYEQRLKELESKSTDKKVIVIWTT